jgi:septal ring factor EnvC (AmiA/AmiB activator)
MQEFRGALEWPLAGRVAVGFGPRLDPRYGTAVPHRGIEIEAAAGAVARAVYPGKVAFAAPLEGYGPTVVVQHAGRVFSLYAGLAELGTKRGDMVSLGSALGPTAGPLYFEIRVENRPEDPLDWLRPRP